MVRSLRTGAGLIIMLVLAACGRAEPENARALPLVTAARVMPMRFIDRIDAIGTARANEQVTLSAPVTERLLRVNFQDGGRVAAGQVIAVLAQGQEAAQLAEARAQMRETGQQLRRLQALRARGFATNASVDAQIAAAAAARAQAAQADASIGDRVIRAPFSGVVSLRTISAGAVVSAGTEIATISDISRIKLDFPVPETLLDTIHPGLAIKAWAAAYADAPFAGSIATIDPVVDAATRSVMVRAILPNPDGRLKPGMLMTVTIEAMPRNALSVPELAVLGLGEERYVFVLEDQDKVRRVAVKTSARQAGRIEIVQGLRTGQQVIHQGVAKVGDGMKVRVMRSRPSGVATPTPPAVGEP